MPMMWHQLQPRPDYGDAPDPKWEAEAVRGAVVCAECRFRLLHTAGEPLDVRLLERPYRRVFGRLMSCYSARREFVEALNNLGSDLLEGFGIGRLLLPSGEPSDTYVTLSPSQAIAIRGGLKSTRNYCGTCGRFRYFPMPWESRHLVKGTFDESRRLHATNLGVLVVRADIWEHIPDVFKKKIHAWPLPVKDEAEDGMHYFPPVWP